MSLRSGFFNSVDGDRKYSAEEMNMPYNQLISNGVFPNPSTSLQVMESSGMTVQVLAGGGLFGGGWAYNDAPVLLTLESAETNLNRVDAIVIKRDTSETVRNTVLYVKKGTPASDPVAPTMIHDDYVDEYCLATIKLTTNVTEITQSMITDTRPDNNVCGWVTGLIDQVDTSTLFVQWQTAYQEQYQRNTEAFNAWFTNLQGILADDESAGAEIIRLNNEKADKNTQTVSLTADGWTLSGDVYTQTVSLTLGENDMVIVSPTVEYADLYAENSIRATVQTLDALTFQSKSAVAVDVIVLNLGNTI